jgi:hypothetical protein
VSAVAIPLVLVVDRSRLAPGVVAGANHEW